MAKCRKCKKCILKNVLRIGKPIIFKKKEITGFYHVPCIFETFAKIKDQRNVLASIDQISGFDEIKEIDQLLVSNLIKNINES